MVKPYFVMFKLLLALPLALAKFEIFPSSHRDNPELSVAVVEVENGMQSGHKQTETIVAKGFPCFMS